MQQMCSTSAENKETSNKYEIYKSNGVTVSVYDFLLVKKASKFDEMADFSFTT